jgi:hypothetical protein
MKKLIALLFLVPVIGFSQRYVAEAPLPAIGVEGFYSIPLPSEITSRLTVDGSNVRIFDEKGVEVPYILQADPSQFSKTEFVEYKIQQELRKGCCTILTLINDKKNTISNIMLEVANADVAKLANLRGSDDRKTWYALKDDFLLGGFSSANSTSELEILSFPLSKYEFYQISIDDSTSAPFKILKAGYYNSSMANGVYTEIPGISIATADSVKDKTTWVKITMPHDVEFVDKIQFDIEGPKFYHRQAIVYTKETYTYKGVKRETLNDVYHFDLTSTHEKSLNVTMKPKDLSIKIVNEDNPSLKVKVVRAWQLRRSLTAWLDAGHTYKVAIAERTIAAPTYDLIMFQDSIPRTLPSLVLGAVTSLEKEKEEVVAPTYFTNRNIIWVAIIAVIAILGTMSVRMLRDSDRGGIKNKE